MGSWLGSGISLRGRPAVRPVAEDCAVTEVASFFEVVEMEAVDWKGTIDVGLVAVFKNKG